MQTVSLLISVLQVKKNVWIRAGDIIQELRDYG